MQMMMIASKTAYDLPGKLRCVKAHYKNSGFEKKRMSWISLSRTHSQLYKLLAEAVGR
jgi:hypothetical protein